MPFDLVVTAVPGFMGYETLKAVIRFGKSAADIIFLPEDVISLDTESKANICTDLITLCSISIREKFNAKKKQQGNLLLQYKFY